MAAALQTTIDDILGSISKAKESGKKVQLIAGAGLSAEAGIPCAAGFVKYIKDNYRAYYDRAKSKTYAELMSNLPLGYRHKIISHFTENAKINLGHLALAQLVKHGFIDCILTTNFDSLITRSCTLVNQDIIPYDLAESRQCRPSDIVTPSVLYLHGRGVGFSQLNTKPECKRQAQILKQIFDHSGKDRVWIVVGYSGKNDALFEHLANIDCFDFELYWVCYQKEDPIKQVSTRLLLDEKWASPIKGFTADSFFITLAKKLGCFLPDFVRWPTPQIGNEFLDKLAPYSGPFQIDGCKFPHMQANSPRSSADGLMEIPGEDREALTVLAGHYLLARRYEEVVDLLSGYKIKRASDLSRILAASYVQQGRALHDEAAKKDAEEAEKLKAQAEEKFQAAEDAMLGMGGTWLTNLHGHGGY